LHRRRAASPDTVVNQSSIMHAIIGSLPQTTTPIERPRERLISTPFLVLRFLTASGAFATGFVQTFVFARILSPERFSIFIVVGAVGYTLWLAELGLPNILFVKLRGLHLTGRRDAQAGRQATAVGLFYIALAIAASLICFVVAFARPSAIWLGAAEPALFLLMIALNLTWTLLRSLSIAVDLFVYYESLELARRLFVIVGLLAVLAGLPLVAFLIAVNGLWFVLFVAAVNRLIGRNALAPYLRGWTGELAGFFKNNRHDAARSSTSALSNAFIALFPYYVVPMLFGLGAAPIILEVTFRVFRGACVIFAAICDLAVPGQTRALAARDVNRLLHTTLFIAALCCIPAAIACALLIFAGAPLFSFLLHTAAVVPQAITPILIVLLIAGVLQTVAEVLLQYTGYFRSLAANGLCVAAAMIVATSIAFLAGLGLVDFLAVYAGIYAAGATALTITAWRGPIRAARRIDKNSHVSDAPSVI
jgi:O-antigen/teichoic acid export membrane protein